MTDRFRVPPVVPIYAKLNNGLIRLPRPVDEDGESDDEWLPYIAPEQGAFGVQEDDDDDDD